MNRSFYITLLLSFLFFACNKASIEIEINKILQTLVTQAKDSTVVYFQQADSLGKEKIRTVIRSQESDSVAIYYKSVDSLKFKFPLTKEDLHQYELVKNPVIDTLISESIIAQWNKEIEKYVARSWKNKELSNLPVIKEKPEYLNAYYDDYNNHPELQKLFYFSAPFFNKNKTKALIYGCKISSAGKHGRLYILSKVNNKWEVIYRGNTFVSSF